MTVKEAQRNIEQCERDITNAHVSLCYAAKGLGLNAVDDARESKQKSMLWLLLSLAGFFLMIIGCYYAKSGGVFSTGMICLIVGIVLWRRMSARLGITVHQVESAKRELDRAVDENAKI